MNGSPSFVQREMCERSEWSEATAITEHERSLFIQRQARPQADWREKGEGVLIHRERHTGTNKHTTKHNRKRRCDRQHGVCIAHYEHNIHVLPQTISARGTRSRRGLRRGGPQSRARSDLCLAVSKPAAKSRVGLSFLIADNRTANEGANCIKGVKEGGYAICAGCELCCCGGDPYTAHGWPHHSGHCDDAAAAAIAVPVVCRALDKRLVSDSFLSPIKLVCVPAWR